MTELSCLFKFNCIRVKCNEILLLCMNGANNSKDEENYSHIFLFNILATVLQTCHSLSYNTVRTK